MNKNNLKIITTTAMVLTALTLTVSPLLVFGKNEGGQGAFDSGYQHGCKDAQIPNSDDRYINQPGKGPQFHSQDFMHGYDTGREACSFHPDSVNYNNIQTDDHRQAINQQAYTTQNGQCPQMILNGDCNIGQSSNNDFASANRND